MGRVQAATVARHAAREGNLSSPRRRSKPSRSWTGRLTLAYLECALLGQSSDARRVAPPVARNAHPAPRRRADYLLRYNRILRFGRRSLLRSIRGSRGGIVQFTAGLGAPLHEFFLH